MDPITLIVTALALGAAAGLKSTAEQAVKDAYLGLKTLIQSKYAQVSVGLVEADPGSETRREVVKEDLKKTSAGQDPEVLKQAKALLDAIQAHAPEAAGIVGVQLNDVKAGSFWLEDIISKGTGVSATQVETPGAFVVKGVRAGGSESTPPKNA